MDLLFRVQNVKALQTAMQKMVLDVVLIENYGQGARHIIVSDTNSN
jgi:hypothetical protein